MDGDGHEDVHGVDEVIVVSSRASMDRDGQIVSGQRHLHCRVGSMRG